MATLMQSATHPSHCSSSTTPVAHIAIQPSPPPSASSSGQGAFAFVRIHNDVCLVQADASFTSSSSKSPLSGVFITPVELAVFRHEFGTMFRLTRRAKLPARDVQLLAPLDDAGVLCDADSGVVFLAREMTDQLLRYTSPRRRIQHTALRSRRRY
ncbi:hypothetical protein ACEPAH_1996 [Sanghuangporus vaninii]